MDQRGLIDFSRPRLFDLRPWRPERTAVASGTPFA